MRYLAYADGSCVGNGRYNARMRGSFAVYSIGAGEINHEKLKEENPIIHVSMFTIPALENVRPTNNIAEACSLRNAIFWLMKNAYLKEDNEIVLCMDSELVLSQFCGVYGIKRRYLREIYAEIYKTLSDYSEKSGFNAEKCLTLKWIPGEIMKSSIIGH